MLNLTKCVGSDCGNTVGVDLEVISLEEADRGWLGEGGLTWALTCASGCRVLARTPGTGPYMSLQQLPQV